jgi:hypothetical protein
MSVRALVLIAAAAGCAPRSVEHATPEPWATLAERDLAAVHRILLENHPGPVDPENRAFATWLERGLVEARALAAKARTYGGYAAALERYGAGFRDGHLGVGFQVTQRSVRWPGFTVGRRGDAYVVIESEGTPAAGDRLVTCDGRAPDQLLDDSVFPWRGDPRLEAHRIASAPWLFVDDGNPFRRLPAKCAWRTAGSLPLVWRELDNETGRAKAQRAAFGPAPSFEVRDLADGTAWVSIPSFAQQAPVPEQLEPVLARVPALRDRRRIVIDVRGNRGGNSLYAHKLVGALWGDAYRDAVLARARRRGKPLQVDWRVSAGNLAFMRKMVDVRRTRFGAEAAAELQPVVDGLAAGLAAGKTYFSEHDSPPAAADPPLPAPATTARVVFLTDGRCGSACLDLADDVLQMPGVVHVGQPTSADTQYMDNRSEPLPSGLATLGFAMKVYRNRPRGNDPYIPRQRFTGDIGDTVAVEAWLRSLP